MSFFHAHIPKFTALLQKFFLPSHQFGGAVCRDRGSSLIGGRLSSAGGPRSVLDPAGCTSNQPPIPRRSKRVRQMAVALRPLCLPESAVVRPLFADSFKSLDGDVEIPHGAKIGV